MGRRTVKKKGSRKNEKIKNSSSCSQVTGVGLERVNERKVSPARSPIEGERDSKKQKVRLPKWMGKSVRSWQTEAGKGETLSGLGERY